MYTETFKEMIFKILDRDLKTSDAKSIKNYINGLDYLARLYKQEENKEISQKLKDLVIKVENLESHLLDLEEE